MRPKSVGRVVPLADDLPSSSSSCAITLDVAGLDVDLDERLLGRVRHPLVRGDQRVGQRLQHDLDRDSLLALDVLERLHHLGVHGHALATCVATARSVRVHRVSFCGRAPLEHGARLRHVGVADPPARAVDVELDAVVVDVDQHATEALARAVGPRLHRDDVVPDRAAEVVGAAQRPLEAGAADLEDVRAGEDCRRRRVAIEDG